jgi:hypothetical protein
MCFIGACGAAGGEEFRGELKLLAEKNIPKGGMPMMFLSRSNTMSVVHLDEEGNRTDTWNHYSTVLHSIPFVKKEDYEQYGGFEEILTPFSFVMDKKALNIKLLPKNPESSSVISIKYEDRNIKTLKVRKAVVFSKMDY